jgi:hypothetical protein
LTLFVARLSSDPAEMAARHPENFVPTVVRTAVLPWGMNRPVPYMADTFDGTNGEIVAGAFMAGWPWRCTWCEWEVSSETELGTDVWRVRVPGRPYKDSLPLPRRIVWTGLVLDTAFYAMALCVMVVGPGRVRRAFRRRRGRCPRCGYDLKHDLAAGCPECGWSRC